MNEKRVEQFIEWFGTSARVDDLDPGLFIIKYFFDRFEFNLEQKYWLSWIYGTTYHFPAAYIIWNEFPDMSLVDLERLTDWNNINYKRLRYQTDTKWNKGHLPDQFKSYKDWVGDSTQDAKIKSLLTGNPEKDFDTMWRESKSWHKFGRYTAWFYLQTIKHCVGVNIESKTLMLEDYAGSRSHRNGLCFALGEDNLVNTKLNEKQLEEFNASADYILHETQKRNPELKDKIDNFGMETALCSFKKLFRIREGRYMGYYLDRQAEEIKKVEQDGWIGINWQPLWQAREESIQKEYLTNKIDTEKMKLYLQENSPGKKLTIFGGLPVTGKTTVMRKIREKLGPGVPKQSNLLRYEEYPNHIVLGIYNGETFDGTDKLSMAVNADTIKFLKKNTKDVLLEGDRLFNLKFLQSVENIGYDLKIYICHVDTLPEMLNRYKRRGKMQDMKFLKGRHTKINNIRDTMATTNLDTNNPLDEKLLNSFIL